MVKVNGFVWTVLEIMGMVLLAAGALSLIFAHSLNTTIQIVYIMAGIALIIVSSAFIQLEGSKLRKEDKEYRRFEKIRDEARAVPNDLDEGYIIDYTADPERAVSYRSNSDRRVVADRPADDSVVIFD